MLARIDELISTELHVFNNGISFFLNRLTVGSGFDLNRSIRFDFSIFISQFDSKFDSIRIFCYGSGS